MLKSLLSSTAPRVAIVTGSGIDLSPKITVGDSVTFKDLHWPVPSTSGHAGMVTCGVFEGVDVVVVSGRVHLYNGFSVAQTVEYIPDLVAAGVDTFIFTNAAGSLHADYALADVGVLTDHINFTNTNPFISPPPGGLALPSGLANAHVDMSNVYDPQLVELAASLPATHKGIYLAVPGPVYETAAEVKAFKTLGADFVGMSTVNEVITARAYGARVLGLSALTNYATGISSLSHSHSSVVATAEAASNLLGDVIANVLLKS